jgi:hypothetical protein
LYVNLSPKLAASGEDKERFITMPAPVRVFVINQLSYSLGLGVKRPFVCCIPWPPARTVCLYASVEAIETEQHRDEKILRRE